VPFRKARLQKSASLQRLKPDQRLQGGPLWASADWEGTSPCPARAPFGQPQLGLHRVVDFVG